MAAWLRLLTRASFVLPLQRQAILVERGSERTPMREMRSVRSQSAVETGAGDELEERVYRLRHRKRDKRRARCFVLPRTSDQSDESSDGYEINI